MFRMPLTVFTLLSMAPAFALDIQVPGDQPTIQAALNAANNGDKIILAPGIYQESIDFAGKNVELASAAGSQLTVLDMANTNGIEMGPAGALVGFTIRNGKLPNGGAVTVEGEGSYLARNVFEGNVPRSTGESSIRLRPRSAPIVERNIFRQNNAEGSAFSASVIALEPDSSPLIANNIFHDNEAIAVLELVPRPAGQPVIVNNTMVRNAVGLAFRPPPPFPGQTYNRTFRNNIIVDCERGVEIRGSTPDFGTFENNLVYANGANYLGGTPDLTGVNGNISEDPLFLDSAASDFHLAPGSPAIDAGTNMSAPAVDFDGNTRPEDGDGNGSSVSDIGAFEAGSRVGVSLVIEGGLEHECNTRGGALVTVGMTTNPEDLEIASVRFFVDDEKVADTSPVDVLAPLGLSLLRVEATTADGTVLEASGYVSVKDTTPPALQAWFENRKTGQAIETITRKNMHHLVIRIEADDICDPDPEVSSVLGTPVGNGQSLRLQGNKGLVSFDASELTLKVSATDHSGNAASLSTTLNVRN